MYTHHFSLSSELYVAVETTSLRAKETDISTHSLSLSFAPSSLPVTPTQYAVQQENALVVRELGECLATHDY